MLPKIYLCSKNTRKLSEFRKVIPSIIPFDSTNLLDFKLNKIQTFIPRHIIQHKMHQIVTFTYPHHGPAIYLVENTSLFVESLSNFPGPYFKDFFNVLGDYKFTKLCKGDATIKTHIGAFYVNTYSKTSHTKIYEGTQKCTIHDIVKEPGYLKVTNDYDLDCIISARGSNILFSRDPSKKIHRQLAIESFNDDLPRQKSLIFVK